MSRVAVVVVVVAFVAACSQRINHYRGDAPTVVTNPDGRVVTVDPDARIVVDPDAGVGPGPGSGWTPDAYVPDTTPIRFSVTPKRLIANGISKARLTVTLHDRNGDPIANRQVTIASDGVATITPSTGVTDANGVMTATLSSTVISELHLTATADALSATAKITLTDKCDAPLLGSPAVAFGQAVPGDFNNDGSIDLVGTTGTGFGLALGNGNGSFLPIEPISNVSSGQNAVAADFNADGKLDIAATTYGSASDNAVILLGGGDGTFVQMPLIPVTATYGDIVTGDFDGDGHIDIATTGVSSGTPPIDVLYGNGAGNFTKVTISSGASPNNEMALIAADVDGDHRTDLISSNTYTPWVTVQRGKANRTFEAAQTFSLGGTMAGVGAMTAAYLNGDNVIDLAVLRYYPSATTVLLGNGAGGFGTPTNLPAGNSGGSIIAFDIDHDADLDLLTSDGAGVYMLKGDGAGNFANPTRTTFSASSMASSDVNSDGNLDLVVGGEMTRVIFGDANGLSFPPPVLEPVLSVAVADFDADSHLDLAAIPLAGTAVEIRRGSGTGTFTTVAAYAIGSTTQSTGTMITADLDNLHGPDLVIVGVLQITLLLNDGHGQFQSSTLFATPSGWRHRGLAVADFDHDGKLDIATSTEAWGATTATLEIAYGNGNGTFQTPAIFSLPVGTFWLVPGNLDGDAYPDLVTHGQSPIYRLLGGAHGSYGSPSLLHSGGGLREGGVVLVDIDHDGKLDLLSSSIDLGIHKGHGDGTFDPPTKIASFIVGNPQLATDVNGDGTLDIIAGDGGILSVLLGRSDGTFDDPLAYDTGGIYLYQHVVAADVDENGLVDLVSPGGILLHRACTP